MRRRVSFGLSERLAAILFGVFFFLIAVPALGLYAEAISGVKPIGYTLWVVFFFVYVLVVLSADLSRRR